MNGYQITLNDNTFVLRLNARGQKSLEDQYQKGANAILMEGIDLTGVRAEVFQQALNYPGNQNPVRDGYDFCDLLADAGYAGPLKTADVLLGLGRASGLVDQDMEADIRRRMRAYVEGVVEQNDRDEAEARPTQGEG